MGFDHHVNIVIDNLKLRISLTNPEILHRILFGNFNVYFVSHKVMSVFWWEDLAHCISRRLFYVWWYACTVYIRPLAMFSFRRCHIAFRVIFWRCVARLYFILTYYHTYLIDAVIKCFLNNYSYFFTSIISVRFTDNSCLDSLAIHAWDASPLGLNSCVISGRGFVKP